MPTYPKPMPLGYGYPAQTLGASECGLDGMSLRYGRRADSHGLQATARLQCIS